MTAWQWENSLSVCRDSPLSGGFCIYLWVSVRRVCNAAQRERRERWRDKEGGSKAERGSAACRERGIESREATRWGGWGGRMRIRNRQRGREGIKDAKTEDEGRWEEEGENENSKTWARRYEERGWIRVWVVQGASGALSCRGSRPETSLSCYSLIAFHPCLPPTNIPTSVLSCYCR